MSAQQANYSFQLVSARAKDSPEPQDSSITLHRNVTPNEKENPTVIIQPPPSPSLSHPVSKRKILCTLLKSTGTWVIAGIAFMVVGILLVQLAILPHIHDCPYGAICPHSISPNNSNVSQLLQTFMQYWLKTGMLIAAFGLLKLSAYQSWFIMMRRGNTIENIDLHLGAIKGSPLDTFRLLFRIGNKWLGFLLLLQIGISTAISLIISLSIIRDTGERSVTFSYNEISRLPDSNLGSLNTDGQAKAIAKVTGWALIDDLNHGPAQRGTLVVPDGRSNSSVNAIPGGSRISGDISCSGYDNYRIEPDATHGIRYNITIGSFGYIANPDMDMAVSMTSVGTALTRYLWVSNTTGIIPNATVTKYGMNIALCNHTLFMVPGDTSAAAQEINPNVPLVSGCDSNDKDVCVADSVSNAIVDWWGGKGTALWKVSCRGGVLGPIKRKDSCPLSADLWVETATSMLDGMMQTSITSGHSTQDLLVYVVAFSNSRWWLQSVIPFATLIAYVLALSYTISLSNGCGTLKKLDLIEIITAAQTDHVRNLVQSGQLQGSVVHYEGDVGFIRQSHTLRTIE